MPQSLSAVYLHLVFSTKGRYPWIQELSDRTDLHAWIGGASKTIGCQPLTVGGVADHVHVLAQLSRTVTQADWVREIKRTSNLWLQDRHARYKGFEWQAGYSVFSVSASQLEKVKQYICNQEEHHKRISFQDEVREFLKKHQLNWDERYLWD